MNLTWFLVIFAGLLAPQMSEVENASSVAASSRVCSSSAKLGSVGENVKQANLALATIQERREDAARAQDLQRVQVSPSNEVAQVRREARQALSNKAVRAEQDALQAISAVAAYQGNDPREMRALLDEVDRAADQLHKALTSTSGGSANYETNSFKCNADRRECKKGCKAETGKVCCCGCGISYIICLAPVVGG